MKLLDSPRSGRLGAYVYYTTPFGQCCRALTMPRDARSPAQARARASFAACSQAWGRSLTEAQRQRWVAAAQTVPSRPSVGQYGPLSGQQFYVRINSVLDCIGQPPVTEPPAPVVFSPNLVTGLEIVQDPEAGLRLRLNVGVATEDIMVFGQAPCSPGRMKHRRVYYLGLLSPSQNGQSDITELYTAGLGNRRRGRRYLSSPARRGTAGRGRTGSTAPSSRSRPRPNLSKLLKRHQLRKRSPPPPRPLPPLALPFLLRHLRLCTRGVHRRRGRSAWKISMNPL